MNPHSLKGLGVLSVVPLEIRDLIYRHVFSDKYCYTALPSPVIGLPGASKALRYEATDMLYSQSKFQFDFKGDPQSRFPCDFKDNPGMRWQEMGPSQEVIQRLDHVEVSINLKHYHSFELFPGEERDMDHFYEDIFRKLVCTDRVRKTCPITFRNCFFVRCRFDQVPFSQNLRRLSAFKNVILEVEHLAIGFEDVKLVDRGPIKIFYGAGDDYLGSFRHIKCVSVMEQQREGLRTYLKATLGEGKSYERRNFRCLAFAPQSTQV